MTANYAITLLPGLLKIKGDKIAPDKTTPQQVESNYKLGDTIPFTITVKNVSTAIVENIIVEDPNAILVATAYLRTAKRPRFPALRPMRRWKSKRSMW